MHPSHQKQQMRHAIEKRLLRMSQKERAAESQLLCQRLAEIVRGATHICAYVPLKNEIDIRPFLQELLVQKKKSMYLPRTEGVLFVCRRITNLEELTAGAYGIPEPPPDAPLANAQEIDCALIPGRAFDRDGNRLGRGNGSYDHWIREQRTANPQTKIWGIAFECQIVPIVPTEEHDERVDALITARGLIHVKPT